MLKSSLSHHIIQSHISMIFLPIFYPSNTLYWQNDDDDDNDNSFRRTPNDPQNQNTFQWPAYDLTNRAYTNLNLVLTSERDLYSQRMQFWLQTIPNLGRDFTRAPLTPDLQVSPTDTVAGWQLGEGSNSTNGVAPVGDRGIVHFLYPILGVIFVTLLGPLVLG